VLAGLLVLAAFLGLLGELLPRLLIYPPKLPVSTAWVKSLGLPYRNIEVKISPELILRGWWFSGSGNREGASRPRGIVIGLHGYAATRQQLLELPPLLCPQGYDVVLYDARAHGESGGDAVTFGYHEKEDLRRVLDFVGSVQPGTPLAAYGFSGGAAVLLQALPEEPRLECVVAESSFASLHAEIHSRVKTLLLWDWPYLADGVLARAGGKAAFSPRQISPLEAAARLSRPVFLAHGMQDRFVPFAQGEGLARVLMKNPGSEWHPVEGADHVLLFSAGGKSYQEAMLAFLARNMDRR
jgi:alpha-beta hydrolase superfamily lysophospholipase